MDLATQPPSSPRLQAGSVAHFFKRSLPRLAFILAAVACLSWATGCGDDTTDDPQNQGGSGGTGGTGGTGDGGTGGTGGTDVNEGGSGGTDINEGGSGGTDAPPPSFSTEALTYTATLGEGTGVPPVCYDFDEEQEVDCEEDDGVWDLMFELAGRSYNIWTNGGIYGAGDGAAFGPLTPGDAEGFLSSREIPGWFRDYLGGTFASSPWQNYNVMGSHDISPNFRVYVVDTGTAQYKVQVLSYYGSGGASGMVTVRFGLLDGEEYEEIELDARAGGFGAPADDPANRFAYLDLETGTVVDIDDATARSTNTIWDLGFKRYDVIVNGGASGPGSATATVARDQAGLYDEDGNPIKDEFVAFTAEMAIDLFEGVDSAEGLTFAADQGNPYLINDGGENSWFGYQVGVGPAANPDVWWAIRGAEGDSFAKMHVTEVVSTTRSFTVELFVQPKAD